MTNRIIMILIFLILISIGGFFIVWPQYQKLVFLNKEIDIQKKSLASIEQYSERIKKLYNEIKEKSDKVKKIDSILPDKIYLPEFLNFFEKLIVESGVSYGNQPPQLSFSEITLDNSKLKEISFGINLQGDYSSIKNAIINLENSTKFFKLPSLSCSHVSSLPAGTSTSATSSEHWDMTKCRLSIKTYSY